MDQSASTLMWHETQLEVSKFRSQRVAGNQNDPFKDILDDGFTFLVNRNQGF